MAVNLRKLGRLGPGITKAAKRDDLKKKKATTRKTRTKAQLAARQKSIRARINQDTSKASFQQKVTKMVGSIRGLSHAAAVARVKANVRHSKEVKARRGVEVKASIRRKTTNRPRAKKQFLAVPKRPDKGPAKKKTVRKPVRKAVTTGSILKANPNLKRKEARRRALVRNRGRGDT